MERPDCCCSCGSRSIIGPISQNNEDRSWWKIQELYHVYKCEDCDCSMYHFFCTSCDMIPH